MSVNRDFTAHRAGLRHAWFPFFVQFGGLTPIQRETIPKVLAGKNVVVASPTASGKTEAVMAPLAERFVREKWGTFSVLYVVPTRALANDSLKRIGGPFSELRIHVVLKHGDRPRLPSRRAPDVLITTPESLDSFICRRPSMFRRLRAVVLDEIHLIDNTYRGDQLRLLLRRLDEIARGRRFSVHLLSATLSCAEEIGSRYVDDFEVVSAGSARSIQYHILESWEEVRALAVRKRWAKILCFCNMRESVERLAARLKPMWEPYPVVAHHGSLSKRLREDAEQVMHQASCAVCVATSTLEIGIDIGDVDAVVLAETPWSVTSLLQRVGRGNRRSDTIQAVAVVETDDERRALEAMFEGASTGNLPHEPYSPDVSVAVQQIFSYAFQNPSGLEEGAILSLTQPLCSEADTRLILSHLRDEGWLEYRSRRWFASTKLMDMGERGHIHSNIPDSMALQVVDASSGKAVGTITGLFDNVFALGGRLWKVVSVQRQRVLAVPFKSGRPLAPHFKKHRAVGAFFRFLPEELRERSLASANA